MQLDPHNRLCGVHPDLVRVIQAAAQAPQPFQIVQGLRTTGEEAKAVATGHSKTMHSRHLPDPRFKSEEFPEGLAMAVDFVCLVAGEISWKVGNAAGGTYGIAAGQIMGAAARLGVKIQWGGQVVGAWADGVVSHFRDWGHIQLDPSGYP